MNYAQIELNLKIMTYKVEEIDTKRIVHLNGEIDMEVADKARQTILPVSYTHLTLPTTVRV